MEKISYEIHRSKETKEWILWQVKETETENRGSFGMFKVYSGTKKECQEKMKEMKEHDGQRKNSNERKQFIFTRKNDKEVAK